MRAAALTQRAPKGSLSCHQGRTHLFFNYLLYIVLHNIKSVKENQLSLAKVLT